MIPWIPAGKVWQRCGRCYGFGTIAEGGKVPADFYTFTFTTCGMCNGTGGWITTRPTNIPGFGAWSIEQVNE